MTSDRNTKIIIILILGNFFSFSPFFINNLIISPRDRNINSNHIDGFDYTNLKTSVIHGPIYIEDDDPGTSWSVAKNAGICTGSGTESDPYVIKNLTIDGGGSGSPITIVSSKVYFKIENCKVYNSGSLSYDAGIRLVSVWNGLIINNTVLNNNNGIRLSGYYNIISGNIIINNNFLGLKLKYGDYNTISGNIINNNFHGVELSDSDNNYFLEDIIKFNSIGISFSFSNHNNISGSIVNNNGHGIQIWDSVDNLVSKNTVNNNSASGIMLSYSYSNIISGNSANFNDADGISLTDSSRNTISVNTAKSNKGSGISLRYSHLNTISGNCLIGNNQSITEFECLQNTIDNNNCGGDSIPFNLDILILVFCGGLVISGGALLLNRRKRTGKR